MFAFAKWEGWGQQERQEVERNRLTWQKQCCLSDESPRRVTYNPCNSPQLHVASSLGQEVAKYYLLENSYTTAIALELPWPHRSPGVRLTTSMSEGWDAGLEPQNSHLWGSWRKSASFRNPVHQSSWLEPPASSLMQLLFPPPSRPSSSSATHIHMLPLTPPAWWPFLTDRKECGSKWWTKNTALRKSSVERGFFHCRGQVV